MPVQNSAVPDTAEAKDQLTAHLKTLLALRGYCNALETTTLNTGISPEPSWMGQLTTNFNTAVGHARTWTDTIEPAMTSTLPQSVIDVAGEFSTSVGNINRVLKDSDNNPSPDQQTSILKELQRIQQKLKDVQANIGVADENGNFPPGSLRATFSSFLAAADPDFDNLTTNSQEIQNAVNLDEKDIANCKADIAQQNLNIQGDSDIITTTSITTATGLLAAVGTGAMGAAVAGPFAPAAIGVGILLGLAALTAEVTVLGLYEPRLNKAQEAVDADNANITAEKKQVLALTQLGATVDGITASNKNMRTALSNITDWWSVVGGKVASVISDVSEASEDAGDKFWSDIGGDLQTASTAWNDLQSFATQYQFLVTSVSIYSVPNSPNQ